MRSVHPSSSPDLCKTCANKRAKDKKDVGFCRGGCNRKLLWHYLICQACQEDGKEISDQVQAEKTGTPTKKPRSAKKLREAEAYYRSKGLRPPWANDETSGTWN